MALDGSGNRKILASKVKQGYRIISIEAADIYRQEQENGVSVGCKMDENISVKKWLKFNCQFVCVAEDIANVRQSKT